MITIEHNIDEVMKWLKQEQRRLEEEVRKLNRLRGKVSVRMGDNKMSKRD